MIHRLYIDNFRCFEDFDVDFAGQPSVLILGKNGTGKSAIAAVLSILRGMAQDNGKVDDFVGIGDFAFDRTDVPMRFGLSVRLDDSIYEYTVTVEPPEKFRPLRIRDEKFVVNATTIFARSDTDVQTPSGQRLHVSQQDVALSAGHVRDCGAAIGQFCKWLASLIVLAPFPPLFKCESARESLRPEQHLGNLAEWFGGVLSEHPASFNIVETWLREVMPDFTGFQNKLTDDSTKRLVLDFQHDSRTMSLGLDRLSDGEKIYLVGAALLAVHENRPPLVCFWDEPDNFVSLSEVGHMVGKLRAAFKKSGQIIIASHNPESIRRFTDTNTLCLERESHLSPARARWLSDIDYKGDLVNSLIMDDLEDGS